MRGAVAARLGRLRGGGAERGILSLFDCGNRSCRRRRPEAAGGRELVAVVSSHNKGRRQSCSSRAASPLTSGSHAHSLLRPLPVCVVFFSPFQKIGGAFSSVSAAAERGKREGAMLLPNTQSQRHTYIARLFTCVRVPASRSRRRRVLGWEKEESE